MHPRRRLSLLQVFLVLCGILFATSGLAEPYPLRVIRIIVPYAAGGNSDVIARTFAAKLSESVGQPVIVGNRPGASGIIGADVVAKAPPDGYTLLMISSGNLTTNPTLFTTLPYDTVRDFTPISNVAYTSYVLAVHPSLPVRSVKELIDLAKAQPGKIDAAIPGSGTGGHLALELFMSMSGTTFTQVAHKGAAPAAGTVRALGQSGATRSPLLPDVPTIAEAGLPGYEASVYNALLGPAGLPRDIANKLQAEVAKAGRRADVQERFAQLGITMTASTPEELADFIKIETAKWAKIIREAGIKSQ